MIIGLILSTCLKQWSVLNLVSGCFVHSMFLNAPLMSRRVGRNDKHFLRRCVCHHRGYVVSSLCSSAGFHIKALSLNLDTCVFQPLCICCCVTSDMLFHYVSYETLSPFPFEDRWPVRVTNTYKTGSELAAINEPHTVQLVPAEVSDHHTIYNGGNPQTVCLNRLRVASQLCISIRQADVSIWSRHIAADSVGLL